MGTPKVTFELLTGICDNIATGDTVKQATQKANISAVTFYQCLHEAELGLRYLGLPNIYARAKKSRAEARFEEIDEILRRTKLPKDDPEYLEPNAARVCIDAIKWQAGKENKGRYGEHVTVDVTDAAKPIDRAEALAQLRSGAVDVSGLLETWTKPALPIADGAAEVPESAPLIETGAVVETGATKSKIKNTAQSHAVEELIED